MNVKARRGCGADAVAIGCLQAIRFRRAARNILRTLGPMDFRPGIILTVTGIVALAHYFLNLPGHLPRGAELIIAVALVVLGVPLLIVAIAHPR